MSRTIAWLCTLDSRGVTAPIESVSAEVDARNVNSQGNADSKHWVGVAGQSVHGETPERRVYEFADFVLDREEGLLIRHGKTVPIAPKAFDLLLSLIKGAPNLVTRDELRQAHWSNSSYIEFEGALNTCVRQARAALGDSASESRYVQTLPKRGYRFVCPVKAGREHSRRVRAFTAPIVALALAAACGWLLYERDDGAIANIVEARSLAILPPVNGPADGTIDPVLAFGISALTTEILAAQLPGRLALTNARSLHSLPEGNWDANSVRRPDLIVTTTIHGDRGSRAFEAVLMTGDEHEVISRSRRSLGDGTAASLLRELPGELSRWIAETLAVSEDSYAEAGQLTTILASDPTLDDAVIRAMWKLEGGDPEDVLAALGEFERILAAQPDHAWAIEGKIAALADLVFRPPKELGTDELYRRLESTARAALDAHLALSRAYQALALVSLYRDWDTETAANHAETAVLLEPADARAHATRASIHAARGDASLAVDAIRVAERLDPLSIAVRGDRCWLLNFANEFDLALGACDSLLALAPTDHGRMIAASGLATALANLGDEASALETLLAAGHDTYPAAFADTITAPRSYREYHCRQAEYLADNGNRLGIPLVAIAASLANCGHSDAAIDKIRQAIDAREPNALYLRISPSFALLHDHAAFSAQLDRLP